MHFTLSSTSLFKAIVSFLFFLYFATFSNYNPFIFPKIRNGLLYLFYRFN